jgi:hypothetical protein
MKKFLPCVVAFLAMNLPILAAVPSQVAARASAIDKRVQTDLSKGVITQDEATKISAELDHIHSAMKTQVSTTSLRRGMTQEMDRLESYLTAKEQGQTVDDSVLGSSDSDSDSDASPTP